jgi:hypothetical protein
MQPYLFPYLGYFQLIDKVDHFIFFDNVNFIKKGFINRNYFEVDGKIERVTFPIENVSQNRFINEHFYTDAACIALQKLNCKNQETQLLITEIIKMIKVRFDVNQINSFCIRQLSKRLGLKTKFSNASDYVKDWDKANCIGGQQKIMRLCDLLNGTEYINQSNGIGLYDHGEFDERGIVLKSFVPKLSENDMVEGQALSIISLLEKFPSSYINVHEGLAKEAKYGEP